MNFRVSGTRVVSGATFILYLPVENKIAYSLDKQRILLSNGEERYRFNELCFRVQRLEEYVKFLMERCANQPRWLRIREYADMNNLDGLTVSKFCDSQLGAFYGVANLSSERVSRRIPSDVPKDFVLLARLAVIKQGVPARDLIMAALISGKRSAGLTVRDLSKRINIKYDTVRRAVYVLKKDGLVVADGRGRIKLPVAEVNNG